jgi:Bifunctional DNA primase/polymerase, N-terminal
VSAQFPPCDHDFRPAEWPGGQEDLTGPALTYARIGLRVFPLAPGTKRPHPMLNGLDAPRGRGGVHLASADPAWVRWCWGQDPLANIGVTGGGFRIDLDVKGNVDGPGNFARWLAENKLELPPMPWSGTPSGGSHVWLSLPPGVVIPGRTGVLPGVDIQGEGKYVVAPPSVFTFGLRPTPGDAGGQGRIPYTWLSGCPCQAPEVPALVEALAQLRGTSNGGGHRGGGGGGGGGHRRGDLPELPPTEVLLKSGVEYPRDDNLTRLAGQLVAEGVPRDEALGILRRVADLSTVAEPWSDYQLECKIDSAAGKGFGDDAELSAGAQKWVEMTEIAIKGLPVSCAEAEEVYGKWLHDPDPVPTRIVLAAYAANMALEGDPVWIMLVGGSGIGKTERIMPVATMPRVVMASTLTGEAALLSASPKRERAKNATGGVLRQIGDHGVLVVKDFTSVLSMSRDRRGEVVGALREIYDGRWDRYYGTDGGQVLSWEGKCGFIAGCTTAIDSAHSVLAAMGTRFLFVRLPEADLDKIARSALAHTGKEAEMRAELARVTTGLLHHLQAPHELHEGVQTWLVPLANLASQARSPVERDSRGEIELVLDAEAPTRIVKQLGQLWRACGMLGLDEAHSWAAVRRAGLDSIPKLRRAVITHLGACQGNWQPTTAIAHAVRHPSRTTRRALEDLVAHGLADRNDEAFGDQRVTYSWALSAQALTWWNALNP